MRVGRGRVLLLVSVLAVGSVIARRQLENTRGPRITGRVVDAHDVRPQDAVVMVWQVLEYGATGSASGEPAAIGRDGSFRTRRLVPGTYVLEIVRTPSSATSRRIPAGVGIVRVGASSVSGVNVAVRRDTAITGRFRMDSETPAPWPTHIAVMAVLVHEDAELPVARIADGGPGGTFHLRNAYGPRVLRFGYVLAPGTWWRPWKVLLDGKDITNTPVDFSEHENGQLEVVFSQRDRDSERGADASVEGAAVERRPRVHRPAAVGAS